MLQSLFRNIPPVVKNLLILNVLFFLAKFAFQQQDIDLGMYLGLHYISSPAFQPYQLATHFFMHADLGHLLFNMISLLVFGGMVERVWGAKRFLIFYFITAIGAAFLHQVVQGIELYQHTGTFFPNIDDYFTVQQWGYISYDTRFIEYLPAFKILAGGAVGASGAIFGLLVAAAMYFPNTEVLLYFAIRVKIKWLALIAGIFEIVSIIQNNPDDSVAHFAHLGGALFGFIIIKIWQRDQSKFY